MIIVGAAYLVDASATARCSTSKSCEFDVNGADHLVHLGDQRTLADQRLNSVLVELVGGERFEAALRIMGGGRLLVRQDFRGCARKPPVPTAVKVFGQR